MNKTAINGIIMFSVKHPHRSNVKNVFAPNYMEYRIKIFREVTLKSLANQTDMDFNVFVLHSDDAPQSYKDIFGDMEKEFPFIRNVWLKDFDDPYAMPGVSDVAFENDVTISFRVDNDDGLPVEFIKNLRGFLRPEFSGFCINWPKITVAQRIARDKYMATEFDFIMNSIGLAYVAARRDNKNIMNLRNHATVRFKAPTVLLPGMGGLQIINGENVLNRMWRRGKKYSGAEIAEYLRIAGYANTDLSILKITRVQLAKHGGPIGRLLFHIGKMFRKIMYK